MLNQVPEHQNKAARTVTLKHPNSYDAVLYRKELLRQSEDEVGGIPTLGGLGILSTEDEPEVDWHELGDAKVLFADAYMASGMNDLQDNVNYEGVGFYARIESIEKPDNADFFSPKKNDIVYLVIGASVAVAYQITGISGVTGIPPYTQRYELQKRDDLMFIPSLKERKEV